MFLSNFSVQRPVAVLMAMIAVIFLGWYGLRQLTVALLPSFSFPLIFLNVSYPNVAPEEMETLVTRPLENAVSQVPGIQDVQSTSFDGLSNVRAQFNFGTNVDVAASDIREQLDRVRNQLPNDPNLGPVNIFKADPTQLPVLILGVNDAQLSQTQLDDLARNTLVPRLEEVPGVASAVESGGVIREVRVEVDNERLAGLGIPISTVINRIAQQNQNIAGGIGKEGGREYSIRVTGLIRDPRDFQSMILATAKDGTPVYLGTVARILDTGKEQRIFGRLNGVPSVGITISQQTDANTVSVANGLYARLKMLEEEYPGLHFAPVYDQHNYIQDSITALQQNALLGGCLAILVILFFLHSFRSTLVVALSIPTSVAGAFLAVYLAGFNLNIMTLGGLALAVGLIVDDAIVVLENIFRRVEAGEGHLDAAKNGAAQIYGAVVSSTVTVMIVFLPLLLLGGVASKLFQPFALVVVFSIGVSLLVALTVVPMLAARFIRRSDVEEAHVQRGAGPIGRLVQRAFEVFSNAYHALESGYKKLLVRALDAGWVVAGVAAAAMIAGVVVLAGVGIQFLPPSSTNYITINYRLPTGTALALNDGFARRVAAGLRADTANVQDVYENVGAGGSFVGFGTRPINNTGQFFVTLKRFGAGSTRTIKTDDYVSKLRGEFGKIAGLQAFPTSVDIVSRILGFATGANQGVDVQLYGPDVATLARIGNQAVERLRGRVPGLINLRTSVQDSAPEMAVTIDRQRAGQLGLTLSDIGNAVATSTNGSIASRLESGGQQYDINVILPPSQRKTTDQLNSIMLVAPITGAVVPLGEVASVAFALGPNQITRDNKQRYIDIQGDVLGGGKISVQRAFENELRGIALPPGYRFDFNGAGQATQNQTFASLGLALVLAVALIYMLLAAKYESLWQPAVIMLTLPLAIVGVGLGLLLFGKQFGLTAGIGLLALIGIVVKNAILVVEFTNQLRAQGHSTKEALLIAGPMRMRPILMTTSATCLGLLPLAAGLQSGSETQAPLGAVVFGGLLTSTLLTLIVIPTAYLNAQKLVDWFGARFKGRPSPPGGNGAQRGGQAYVDMPDDMERVQA